VITTGTGTVTLRATDSLIFGETGDVRTTGSGIISLRANSNNVAGDTSNVIRMNDGTLVLSRTGRIVLDNSGVTLGAIRTAVTGKDSVEIVTSGAVLEL
jgi:hypothetical protein